MKTIYIVKRTYGDYEDCTVTNLRTYFNENSAKKYRDHLYVMKSLQEKARSSFIKGNFTPTNFLVPEPKMDLEYKKKMVYKMKSPDREERVNATGEWTRFKFDFDTKYQKWRREKNEFYSVQKAEFDKIEAKRFEDHVNTFNFPEEIKQEVLNFDYSGDDFLIDECEHFEEE